MSAFSVLFIYIFLVFVVQRRYFSFVVRKNVVEK